MKNQSREFATMTDEERRKFALDNPAEGEKNELDLEEPRDPDRMGRDYQNPEEEYADPEHRDGTAALLDDEQHAKNVRRNADRRDG